MACLFLGAFGLVPSTASATTENFAYTGAEQTWIVPAGVTSATFDLYGAEGHTGSDGSNARAGGKGGHATATLAVVPGTSIQVTVGGKGVITSSSITPGFNGGGNGSTSGTSLGGPGGGATDVRVGGTALGDRVLVAGGGGGGGGCALGASTGGDGGDLNGGDGSASACSAPMFGGAVAGGGGTQSDGGTTGTPGTSGTGGAGFSGGGGGGGGYYGGGGGSGNAGGGGGSGFGPSGTTFETGVRSGDGVATVTYEASASDQAGPNPACDRLRKKRKRQKSNLGKAHSDRKRSQVKANIQDTDSRLKKFAC